MDYAKGVLSVVSGTIFALIGPDLLTALRYAAQEKATGIAVVAGAFPETISIRFWILALVFSVFFWAASRLRLRALRVLLFWAPTILLLAIGGVFSILFAYLRIHSGRG